MLDMDMNVCIMITRNECAQGVPNGRNRSEPLQSRVARGQTRAHTALPFRPYMPSRMLDQRLSPGPAWEALEGNYVI